MQRTALQSKDVELRANIVSGVSGGAFFSIEQRGVPATNFTMADSVLLAGNCEPPLPTPPVSFGLTPGVLH